MFDSQEGSNVHSTNIRELIAHLKRNKDLENSHNKEITYVNTDVEVLQEQYVNVEDNKRRKLCDTQNLQPSIKNYFNVVKSDKDTSSSTVRNILNKFKNKDKSHLPVLKVRTTKNLNKDQILWKNSGQLNSNREIGDTSVIWKENNSIKKLEPKLPSSTNRQLHLTDFFKVPNEYDIGETVEKYENFRDSELRHVNTSLAESKNCLKKEGKLPHNEHTVNSSDKCFKLSNSSQVNCQNLDSNTKSEVLRMIEDFKKKCYGKNHKEETKLRSNKENIVPSISLKNEHDENKTTFDDFCRNVMKTMNVKSQMNDSAPKRSIRKCVLSNKENYSLPKSCSTGQITEKICSKNCNRELNSLPITDSEIKSRQESLEENKITFDDFMNNIARDINNSRHMANRGSSQEKTSETCGISQVRNSINKDGNEVSTIIDLLKCRRNGKNRSKERKELSESGNERSYILDKTVKVTQSLCLEDTGQENLNFTLENNQKNNNSARSKNIDQVQNVTHVKDSKYIKRCGTSGIHKSDTEGSETEDFLSYFPSLVSKSTEQPVKVHTEPDFQKNLLNEEDPNLLKGCSIINEIEYINTNITQNAYMHTQNVFYLDDYEDTSTNEREQVLGQPLNIHSSILLQENSVLLQDQLSKRNSNEMVFSNLLEGEIVTNALEDQVCQTIDDQGKENDVLEQFFENLIKEYSSKRSKVPKIEPLQKKKHPVKRYKKGRIKIYRLKRLKKPRPKTESNTVEQVEENLNLNDLLKKLTQDIVDSEHTLPRSKSMSSVSTPSSYITDITKSDVLSTGSNELTSPQQRLRKGINELSQDKSLLCNEKELENVEHTKDELKMKIQEVFLKVAEDFMEKDHSLLKLRKQSFNNCIFKDGRLQLKPLDESLMTSISSGNVRSQTKFKLILYILKKIQTLLATDTKLTKRELYYQLKTLVTDQRVIDRIINAISCLLNVGMWALNIIAQKGLVFGNLKMLLSSGETLNCNIPGTLIPQDINEIVEIQSVAYFILVVEKESVFYKLIEEGLPEKLTRPFIMITGKGFPDLNTQLFLKKLWIIMSIPVFILVDADPHGINIMLNYRFGSVNNAHVSHHLAVPNAKWLGVYPSEVANFNLTKEQLSERELKLVSHLLRTPYVECHPRIVDELKVLLEKKYKAEIEGLIKSDTYLSEVYLPNKFFTHNFI